MPENGWDETQKTIRSIYAILQRREVMLERMEKNIERALDLTERRIANTNKQLTRKKGPI